MKCEDCLPLVEEYADGELDEKTNDLMARHLDACAPCTIAYQKVMREEELYLRYECDSESAPAFWENVMARAVADDNKTAHTQTLSRPLSTFRDWLHSTFGNFSAPRFSPSLTALMVLIAVGLTVVLMSYLNSRETSSLQANVSQGENAPSAPASATPGALVTSSPNENKDEVTGEKGSEPDVNKVRIAGNDGGGKRNSPALVAQKETAARFLRKQATTGQRPTPDALIREAEKNYVAAINMLSRDLNRRRSQLDPETAAQFERTLLAVDRTIADTRRAARKHPNDPVAAKYVLTAYAKKVDVLREMIGY